LDSVIVTGLGLPKESKSTEIVFLFLAGLVFIALGLIYLSRLRYKSPRKKKIQDLNRMGGQYSTMNKYKSHSLMDEDEKLSQNQSIDSVSTKPLTLLSDITLK
jgi:hypothetical protein